MHPYLPYVDGLRALAVLSVLIYHLNPTWLPGGFSGVDIFFVISGFIVSASAGQLDHGSLPRFMLTFYARRMQRILPALIVCLLVTTLATALFIPSAWLSDGIQKTGIFAFFGLSNFILGTTNKDYFSPAAEFNPFTHTWSLGVEEQFYLIFPALFYLWAQTQPWRRRTLTVTLILLAGSLAYSAYLGNVDRNTAFYMVTSRFWQLAAGVLLFQLLVLFKRYPPNVTDSKPLSLVTASWLSLSLVIYGLIAAQPARFPFPGATATVLGTLGLLGCLLSAPSQQPLIRLLTNKPVLWIGRISYSLYLWHWPVFVLFRWTIGLDTAPQRLAAIILAFALATISWRWIETPVRRWPRHSLGARQLIVIGGLVAIGLGTWLATRINHAQRHLTMSSVSKMANDWYPEPADHDPMLPDCRTKSSQVALSQGYLIIHESAECGRPRIPSPRLFAIGDSHALGYMPLYTAYALQTGQPVHVYANGGCGFISLRPHLEAAESCRQSRAAAINDLLTRLRPGDVVFLSSLRLPRFSDQWARFPEDQVHASFFSEQANAERHQAEAEAQILLGRITEKGARVLFEAPKPILKAPLFRCAESYNQSNSVCEGGVSITRRVLETYRSPVLASFARLAAHNPSISVWDPFPLLCPADATHCDPYRNGKPLYFDGDHLSGYGNRFLFPHFLQAVRQPDQGG